MTSLTQPGFDLHSKPFIANAFPAIISLVLLLTSSVAGGQKLEVDAVYLNTGEIYRGRIQAHINPGLVQLETLCHDTRLFLKDEITRIEKEKVNFRDFSPYEEASVQGYFNHTDLGFLIGSGNNDRNVIFSIQMVNGYKFGRKYFPGIGAGIEFYDQAYVPVYGDFKYFLSRHRVSPFLKSSLGYSIPIEDPPEQWGSRTDNRGGILYSAGFGTSIRTGGASALVISLDYRFQSLKSVYTEDWNDEVLNLEKQLNRVSLRIGFMFD